MTAVLLKVQVDDTVFQQQNSSPFIVSYQQSRYILHK